MPGKPINQQQVNLYMSYRKQTNQSQSSSAAKAGFSERTARRIDIGEHSVNHSPRQYKTRKDPFDGLFEKHVIPLLQAEPQLQPITLFEKLEDIAPNQFDKSQLRTLQRRVKRWRATDGPEQDVIFRQAHEPGAMGISDYTWATKLRITLAGQPFDHKLYHYRLVFSGWTYVQVILGGESFESLSSGLQNALWRSGGVPKTHRTDSLSAAFKNHTQEELLTERYEKLCHYYSVKPTRNNKGVAHENGAIEGPNGHLKRKIEQQLLLRGHRDFVDLAAYQQFIDKIVSKINRQCQTRFKEERSHLSPLPARRTNDFSEEYVKVTSSSTITLKRVIYTVPSRLIGSTMLVHINDQTLKLFLGHLPILTLIRVHAQPKCRARSVDYRHVIHSLAKKTNSFRCSQIRDDLIPQGDFWLLWQRLIIGGVTDDACRYMVDLLLISANCSCESALSRYVLDAYDAGNKVKISQCRFMFGPAKTQAPEMTTTQHMVSDYDFLMGAAHA
jgi:hypothetical protein